MDKQTIKILLEKHEKMDAAYITIPFDVEAVYGAKRVPVVATINGASHRSTIVRMGGKFMLGIPKEFREAAGVSVGEIIAITLEKDSSIRTVDVPPDLAAELSKAGLQNAWDRLAFTHKKEHVRSITDAKKPETRKNRIEKTVAMVAAGVR